MAAEAGPHVRSTQQHDDGVPAGGKVRPPSATAHSGMQTEESESRFASQAFHALLHDKTRGMAVRNAGIVGGRRAVFERALSTVVDRMRGLTEIGDMVCAAPCLQACSPMCPSL